MMRTGRRQIKRQRSTHARVPVAGGKAEPLPAMSGPLNHRDLLVVVVKQ